mmetsp:Transcript_29750/g.44135  ORF Transcript_29750/g.44135 Transcript_29750/m.44135 type:complete len:81 (-) Transcript_29750:184-426(-)
MKREAAAPTKNVGFCSVRSSKPIRSSAEAPTSPLPHPQQFPKVPIFKGRPRRFIYVRDFHDLIILSPLSFSAGLALQRMH